MIGRQTSGAPCQDLPLYLCPPPFPLHPSSLRAMWQRVYVNGCHSKLVQAAVNKAQQQQGAGGGARATQAQVSNPRRPLKGMDWGLEAEVERNRARWGRTGDDESGLSAQEGGSEEGGGDGEGEETTETEWDSQESETEDESTDVSSASGDSRDMRKDKGKRYRHGRGQGEREGKGWHGWRRHGREHERDAKRSRR